MTPVEFTERELGKLVADIEPDIEALDRLAEKVRLSAAHGGGADDAGADDAGARAYLAVQLHHYYTALETILERLLRGIDGSVPTSQVWHRELLRQAARAAPDLRPAILEPEVAGELSHLLSFRHFFRHAYAVELDWSELESHRARVAAVHVGVKGGLLRTVAHLRSTIEALRQMEAE